MSIRVLAAVLCTLALPAAAAVVTVTNTTDSGPGSLRQAILDVNDSLADTIHFAIGSGPATIKPLTNLPIVEKPVTIDGRTQPGYGGQPLIEIDGTFVAGPFFEVNGLRLNEADVYALAITRFGGPAIKIAGGTVRGCHIGVDGTGTEARENTGGIHVGWVHSLFSPVQIGGLAAGEGNLISSNIAYGVHVPSGPSDTVIAGNIFGGNAAMSQTLGFTNYHVEIQNNAVGATIIGNVFLGSQTAIESFYSHSVTVTGNAIGVTPFGAQFPQIVHGVSIYQSNDALVSDNVIRGALNGVSVAGNALRNVITSNDISGSNLGIDLAGCCSYAEVTGNDDGDEDTGPNNYTNFPEIVRAISNGGSSTTITGALASAANRTYTIELFSSVQCGPQGYGAGNTHLESFDVTTDGAGHASFTRTLGPLATETAITATATTALEGTSEFSRCAEVEGLGRFELSPSYSTVLETQLPNVTVQRSGGAVGAASVDWKATGDALPGLDFLPTGGTLHFDDGQTWAQVPIQLGNDNVYEKDETLTITLSNAFGAALGTANTAQLVIRDDDPKPHVVLESSRQVVEGSGGSTPLILTVRLDAPAAAPIGIHYGSFHRTTSTRDLHPVSASPMFIPAGSTEGTIELAIVGDRLAENNETFTVRYTDFDTGQDLGETLITIVDDDEPAVLSVNAVSVVEGNTDHFVIVNLSATAEMIGTVHVSFRANGATPGSDYEDVPKLFHFFVEDAKSFKVRIRGDREPEADEQFVVVLSYAGGAFTLGNKEAPVTIVNDDTGVGPASQWIAAGSTGTYQILFGVPAKADAVIALSSSAPDVVSVPNSITVPAGSIAAMFEARALQPGGSSQISVALPPSLGGEVRLVEALTYVDANLSFAPNQLSMYHGQTATVRVALTPKSATDTLLTLTFDRAVLTAPSQIIISPSGEASFDVTASGTGTIALHATLPQTHGGRQVTLFGSAVAAPDQPTILRVTPGNGPTSGGTIVDVGGAKLRVDCVVRFGGAPAMSQTFISESLLKATAPPHPAGSVAVTMTCGADTSTLDNAFLYSGAAPGVQSVTPQSGSTRGGTHVRIGGTNFDSSCWAFFGDTAAGGVEVESATAMTAIVPAHAAGNVDVVVRCSGGDGLGSSLFTYVEGEEPAAAMFTITPLAASAGEIVTLLGSRFRSDDVIRFGDTLAELVESGPDAHLVRVPDLPLGKTSIDLIDITGRRLTTGPIFTVLEQVPPRITGIAPTRAAAGAEIILTGAGFRTGYTFKVGGMAAIVIARSYNEVRIRVSRETPAGNHPVEVFNPAGQLSSIGPTLEVLGAGLTLRGVTPNCATTDGLADVTILGTGFVPGMQVLFDNAAATNVIFVDASTLRVRVPPGQAGPATVRVIAPDGTSATLTNAFDYDSPFDPNGGCSGRRNRAA